MLQHFLLIIFCAKKYDRKEEEERKCKSLKNRGKMIKDKNRGKKGLAEKQKKCQYD